MARPFEPYLMILMRKDLASMTGGRAAAQASHATSRFTCIAEASISPGSDAVPAEPIPGYSDWKLSTNQNFGTAIVIGVTGYELEYYNEFATREGYEAEVIIDPTYPLKDGDVYHLISIPTCGYIFVNKDTNILFPMLKLLPLF